MTLYTMLMSLLEAILSPLFAWFFDRHAEPAEVSAKRRELLGAVPHGAAVLEVGAGTGTTLASGAYEGAAGRFGRLVLSEPDRGMRDRLRAKLGGRASGVARGQVEVSDAALPRLAFDDAAFDAVGIFLALSHVHGRAAALKEMVRVLRPGGKFLLLDHGVHAHGKGHGGGEQGRNAHGGQQVKRPFFLEWLSFLWDGISEKDFDCEALIAEVREEVGLQEVFVAKMKVKDTHFHEIVYGCFEKKQKAE